MAIYRFSWQEYYPYYVIDDSLGQEIELTEEEYRSYKDSIKEFLKWQDFINSKYPPEKRYH